MDKKYVRILAVAIISFMFLALFIYFTLPIINIIYIQNIFFIAVVVILVGCGMLLSTKNLSYIVNNQTKKIHVDELYRANKKGCLTFLSGVGVFLLAILLTIASQPIFRSNEYYDVIAQNITNEDFKTDFDKIDTSNYGMLPNVDSSLAQKKATILFGEEKGFGSKYQLGMFTDQIVNGKFVMVAPIEHSGFFKYMNNKEYGTPGYIVVDKQNYDSTKGSELVLDHNFKYLPSSFFSDDLMRHIYMHGYSGYDIRVSGFELDDELNPYWVINIYKHKVLPYGTKLVDKILTVDPENGRINEYDVEDAPKWIDNIQDNSTIMQRLNDYGQYELGYLNSMFAKDGVVTTTDGSRHVILDGQLYLYTGLTSAGADESISQIVLVNKRTMETKLYNVSGATEYAAMLSAEGALQNYNYVATFPIPTNVGDVPTYFIPLKDNLGLIKCYTFVQINNHEVIGIGDTITQALNAYISALDQDGTTQLEEVTGVVKRISFVGERVYILLDNNTIYTLEKSILEAFVTNVGDNISIKVSGNLILEFDNLDIE